MDTSLCPFGVHMTEVRLFIYLLVFAKLYSPIWMFMCFCVSVHPYPSYRPTQTPSCGFTVAAHKPLKFCSDDYDSQQSVIYRPVTKRQTPSKEKEMKHSWRWRRNWTWTKRLWKWYWRWFSTFQRRTKHFKLWKLNMNKTIMKIV